MEKLPTVDGSEIRRSPVEVGSLSHYSEGFPQFHRSPWQFCKQDKMTCLGPGGPNSRDLSHPFNQRCWKGDRPHRSVVGKVWVPYIGMGKILKCCLMLVPCRCTV